MPRAKRKQGARPQVITVVFDPNLAMHAALGDLLGIVDRAGGFMTAEDQILLANARRVHRGGVNRGSA